MPTRVVGPTVLVLAISQVGCLAAPDPLALEHRAPTRSVSTASASLEAEPPAVQLSGRIADASAGDALLVGFDPNVEEFFIDLIDAAWDDVDVVLAVSSDSLRSDLDGLRLGLEARGRRWSDLRVLRGPAASAWVRDYGPSFVAGQGGVWAIDFDYEGYEDEDAFPEWLSNQGLSPLPSYVPLEVEGGNLLSDGSGHCLTSTELLRTNEGRATEQQIRTMLAQRAGCRHLHVLPALKGERTGHVDTFVTMVGPQSVIVAEVDDEGAEAPFEGNAALLDEAAAQLIDAGFEVRRMPLPPPRDGIFRSYNNALVLPSRVLVPTFEDVDARSALAAFRAAFPNKAVVPIDATTIIILEGALHCVTLPLHGLTSRASRTRRGT